MEPRNMPSAIFMDRDGTVSHEVGYMYHAGLYKPFPWTGRAIQRINQSGVKAILVTNQSGVGRGYFAESTIAEVHDVLKEELARWNAHLDAIYYCPHSPEDGCECRKPNPGMLWRARQELQVVLEDSYVIGDRYLDIEMAHAVGAKGVLVLTGDGANELAKRKNEAVQPDMVSENLLTAVETILG
jgi:D-glycero-D-manno-heptose 1,7-bisphosphate phosphatase